MKVRSFFVEALWCAGVRLPRWDRAIWDKAIVALVTPRFDPCSWDGVFVGPVRHVFVSHFDVWVVNDDVTGITFIF